MKRRILHILFLISFLSKSVKLALEDDKPFKNLMKTDKSQRNPIKNPLINKGPGQPPERPPTQQQSEKDEKQDPEQQQQQVEVPPSPPPPSAEIEVQNTEQPRQRKPPPPQSQRKNMHGKGKYKFQMNENQRDKGVNETFVHLIPHSHDDLGWVQTIEDYWVNRVSSIYTLVTEAMLKDSNRTFVYDGIDFLKMWYVLQNDEMKEKFKKVLHNGQVEIVNGGWSEHDDGLSYYSDIITNIQYGHQYLKEQFDYTPTIAWQIDVFGITMTSARIFGDIGMKANFLNRIDVGDRNKRRHFRELEVVWRPYHEYSGKDTELLAHVFWHHYAPPECFEIRNHEDLLTSKKLENEEDWDKFIEEIHEYVEKMVNTHISNHVMLMMGDDFLYYARAEENMQMMEDISERYNKKYPLTKFQFSTPSRYIEAIHSQNLTFPVKYDDYLQFTDSPQQGQYWSGYYTTRPNLKSLIRQATLLNQSLFKFFSIFFMRRHPLHSLSSDEVTHLLGVRDFLLDNIGMATHHDTITGTCQQHVANDYADRISQAIASGREAESLLMKQQIEMETGIKVEQFLFCDRFNGSFMDCPAAFHNSKNEWLIGVFNPSLRPQFLLKLRLPHSSWRFSFWVSGLSLWQPVPAESICEDYMLDSKETIVSCDTYVGIECLPMDFCYLKMTYDESSDLRVRKVVRQAEEPAEIGNSVQIMRIVSWNDEATFMLFKGRQQELFSFDMRYYVGIANPRKQKRDDVPSSGVYMFITNNSDNGGQSNRYAQVYDVTVYKGRFVEQITLKMRGEKGNYVTAHAKLEKIGGFQGLIHWEVLIYGANPRDKSNEITANFKAFNLDSKEVFYTDGNGLKMIRRKLNYREQFPFESEHKTSSNFYPVGSAIAIVDENSKLQLTVMNDRAMGGSSLQRGRIELHCHRRVFGDDQRGLGEHLDERSEEGKPIHVEQEFAMQLFNKVTEKSLQREWQVYRDEPMQVFWAHDFKAPPKTEREKFKMQKINYFDSEGLREVNATDHFKFYILPFNLTSYYIRIENLDDLIDHNVKQTSFRNPPVINLQNLIERIFKTANKYYEERIIDLSNQTLLVKYDDFTFDTKEKTLTGTVDIEEARERRNKYRFNSADDQERGKNLPSYKEDQPGSNGYVLDPMRLRAFMLEIKEKNPPPQLEVVDEAKKENINSEIREEL